MLKNTFHHIPGIGAGTESGLWKKGINSWKDITENKTSGISAKRLSTLKQHVDISLEHLENSHFKYFEEQLPSNLIWRIFPEVRSQTAYLDIETTGLEGWDEITTIALYDGKEIKTFVNSDNLEQFPEAMEGRSVHTRLGVWADRRVPSVSSRSELRNPLPSACSTPGSLVMHLRGCWSNAPVTTR